MGDEKEEYKETCTDGVTQDKQKTYLLWYLIHSLFVIAVSSCLYLNKKKMNGILLLMLKAQKKKQKKKQQVIHKIYQRLSWGCVVGRNENKVCGISRWTWPLSRKTWLFFFESFSYTVNTTNKLWPTLLFWVADQPALCWVILGFHYLLFIKLWDLKRNQCAYSHYVICIVSEHMRCPKPRSDQSWTVLGPAWRGGPWHGSAEFKAKQI